MSPHHSHHMSQESQVSRITLWGCSLNVFVIFFVFVIVIVYVIFFFIYSLPKAMGISRSEIVRGKKGTKNEKSWEIMRYFQEEKKIHKVNQYSNEWGWGRSQRGWYSTGVIVSLWYSFVMRKVINFKKVFGCFLWFCCKSGLFQHTCCCTLSNVFIHFFLKNCSPNYFSRKIDYNIHPVSRSLPKWNMWCKGTSTNSCKCFAMKLMCSQPFDWKMEFWVNG